MPETANRAESPAFSEPLCEQQESERQESERPAAFSQAHGVKKVTQANDYARTQLRNSAGKSVGAARGQQPMDSEWWSPSFLGVGGV